MDQQYQNENILCMLKPTLGFQKCSGQDLDIFKAIPGHTKVSSVHFARCPKKPFCGSK